MKSKCWFLFLRHRWNLHLLKECKNRCFWDPSCRHMMPSIVRHHMRAVDRNSLLHSSTERCTGGLCYFCTSRRKATTPHSFPSLSPGNKEISTSCGFVWGRIAFIRTIQNSKLPPCLFLQSYAAWEDLFSLLQPRVKSASEVMSDIHTWDEESHL